MCLNHPQTTPYPWSVEELSFTKLVPGDKKVGDCWFSWSHYILRKEVSLGPLSSPDEFKMMSLSTCCFLAFFFFKKNLLSYLTVEYSENEILCLQIKVEGVNVIPKVYYGIMSFCSPCLRSYQRLRDTLHMEQLLLPRKSALPVQ